MTQSFASTIDETNPSWWPIGVLGGLAICALGLVASSGRLEPIPGPSKLPTCNVAGQLILDGTPINTATLTFMPLVGTVGDHILVEVDQAGKFMTTIAPVGTCTLRIHLRPADRDRLAQINPQLRGWADYIASVQSNLTVNLRADKHLELDLKKLISQPNVP